MIAKATSKNPDDRFQTCADFAYALKHYKQEDAAYRKALNSKWWGFLGTAIAPWSAWPSPAAAWC